MASIRSTSTARSRPISRASMQTTVAVVPRSSGRSRPVGPRRRSTGSCGPTARFARCTRVPSHDRLHGRGGGSAGRRSGHHRGPKLAVAGEGSPQHQPRPAICLTRSTRSLLVTASGPTRSSMSASSRNVWLAWDAAQRGSRGTPPRRGIARTESNNFVEVAAAGGGPKHVARREREEHLHLSCLSDRSSSSASSCSFTMTSG